MKSHLINRHLLIPRSKSSAKVKVKYKGYISQKNGRFGGIRVSQTHLVFTENQGLAAEHDALIEIGHNFKAHYV